MSRDMLINVVEGEECRVAVVEDGVLEELYLERASFGHRVGSIYKGKVVNIEPGIQAVFIDFGIGKNGFLHVSDLHPRYFPGVKKAVTENIGRRKSIKQRQPIQKCLHKGDELIVQVTKEGLNTKGPTLSTYIALPGKYLVMMPWMNKLGVSQKIEDEEQRVKLRRILEESKLSKDMGVIIRTAAQGCSKKDIQNDLRYLGRLWVAIEKRMSKLSAPCELYQESDLVIRTMRDVFTSRISRVMCDSEKVVQKIKDFLSLAMPRLKSRVAYYDGNVPLFNKYKIEQEIARIQYRKVDLKCGGSIVIEQTEALVAIDVNSGRYRGKQNAEQTAYRINTEAAIEIARQLRLRDLGGLIVCDFIDMYDGKHRRDVEKTFREAVKADRARSKILRISQFGLLEMTRQRIRPSLQSSTYLACPHCKGSGYIKSHESMAIEVVRLLNLSASKKSVKCIELSVSQRLADYLQNEKRSAITEIEQLSGKKITIHSTPNADGEKYNMVCYDERGMVVKLSNK